MSLIIIILNSTTLTLESPKEENSENILKDLESYFIWIYTVEMVMKIIG